MSQISGSLPAMTHLLWEKDTHFHKPSLVEAVELFLQQREEGRQDLRVSQWRVDDMERGEGEGELCPVPNGELA